LTTLLEKWALTLPTLEAESALHRPDRAALHDIEMAPNLAGFQNQRLLDAAVALAQEHDVNRVTEAALDAAIAITGAERGILLLLDGSGEHRIGATRHVGSEAGALVGLSTTIARRALREGEVIVANDVRRDPRFSDCASVALEVSNVLCAPIHARGQIEGALYLDRRGAGRPFDETAAAGARALGAIVAASLLNARVIAELTDKTAELETAREELSTALASRTVERNDMSRRLAAIQDVVPAGVMAIVGRSPPIHRMRRTIEMVSASDAPVLIAGETGTGKELVARAIHATSNRRDRPFVAINCGALSENLLAAELFGAERGAYTSATSARPGLFVAADRGTLFLDEVGDMPHSMQVALLRVLETSEIRPVGATRSRRVDVRILAASHRDLLSLVRAGTFRDDLRYRLEVIRVEVPPLRERLDDLQELSEHLLREARRVYGLPERRLSSSAIAALELRRWPGNVRELKHVLASAALATEGPIIGLEDIPAERAANPDTSGSEPPPADVDGHALRADSIRRALRATAGNRGQAAKLLGISRSTLYRYLESHGIAPDSVHPSAEAEEAKH
jgi:serine/threonine-protein kinase PknK